jgi:hypothetical protein
MWPRVGFSGGFCEHDSEPLTFIRGGKFDDKLSEYQLIERILLCEVSIQH